MAGYIGKSQGVVLTDIDNDSVTTADIQDNAITADKLNVTGSGTSGQALTSDADGSFSWTTIASDLVDDTTPQLGGDLASNGNDILFADNDKAVFGASNDLQIYHDGSNSYIDDQGTGNLNIRAANNFYVYNSAGTKTLFRAADGAGNYLYYDNSAKLATTSTGVNVTGDMTLSSSGAVNSELRSDFAGLQIGTTSNHYLAFRSNNTERMRIDTSGNLKFNSGYGSVATAYGCRAFVNFNGVSNPPSIRRAGNVSSITDNGTGDYTINFTTAMVDSDYTATAMGRVWPGVQSEGFVVAFANYSANGASQRTPTSLRVVALNQVTNRTDSPSVGVAIFR